MSLGLTLVLKYMKQIPKYTKLLLYNDPKVEVSASCRRVARYPEAPKTPNCRVPQ